MPVILTQPETIWVFHEALQCFDEIRPSAAESPLLALADEEREWQFRRRDYLKRGLCYRIHSWRRRNRSSWEYTLFAIMEWGGSTVSAVHNPFHVKRVRPEIVHQAAELLQPGDVLVTRHNDAMTNLFLPGFFFPVFGRMRRYSPARKLSAETLDWTRIRKRSWMRWGAAFAF